MQAQLTALVSKNAVVIFSWVTCPYCVKAKTLLGALSKDVQAYDIDTMAEGNALQAEIIKQYNHETVPAIFIKGQFVGGFSDVDALHKSGDLVKRLA